LLALLGAHHILHVGRIRVQEIIEIRGKKKNVPLHMAFLDYDLAKQIVAQLHRFCNQSIVKQ
jgi:hypothetical protein